MSATIIALFSTLAITAPINAEIAQPSRTEHGCPFGCGGGGGIDIDIGIGGEPDECFGIDIDVGADCGILAGLDFFAECDPLAVEAACIAELGVDCGVEAFAACTASLVAQCQADLEAGGAIFCDGQFVGGDLCWGGIDVDVDVDLDGCLDLDVDVDVDVDLDLCLNVDLDLNLDCAVEVGAECYAACDPLAVEAWCYAEVESCGDYDENCDLGAFAACQAEVIAKCQADCDLEGALFCDGGVYVGADICLDLGLDLDIGL